MHGRIDRLDNLRARRSFLMLVVTGLGSTFVPASLPCLVMGQENAAKQESKDKFSGRIFTLAFGGELGGATIAIEPNSRTWEVLFKNGSPHTRLSPDGRSVVTTASASPMTKRSIEVSDLHGEKPSVLVTEPVAAGYMGWFSDNKHVIVGHLITPGDLRKSMTWKIATDGSERVRLPIPETEWIQDISPDGRWAVALSSRPPWDQPLLGAWNSRPAYLVRLDGGGGRVLVEGSKDPDSSTGTDLFRFSPDGQTIVYHQANLVSHPRGRRTPDGYSLWLIGVDGKNPRCIRERKPELFPLGACWSPDGKWLAVTMMESPPDPDLGVRMRNTKVRVEIINPEGRTDRTVNLPRTVRLAILDWR